MIRRVDAFGFVIFLGDDVKVYCKKIDRNMVKYWGDFWKDI